YEQIRYLIFTDNNIKFKPSDKRKTRDLTQSKFKNYIDNKLSKFKFDDDAILNTFEYLYYHTRSGIYCEIKNNVLSKFIMFVNPEYENNWDPIRFLGFKNHKNMTIEQMLNSEASDFLTLEEYKIFKSDFI